MADNNDIFELLTKMYSEMQEIKTDVSQLKTDVTQLKTDVNKNTLTLENMNGNIKLLVEGQESFREQIGRSDNEDKRTVNERLETIELAIRSTSKDVKVVKRRVENTEEDVIEIQSHLKIIK